MRVWFRRRLVPLPRIIKTKVSQWRITSIGLVGLITALLLALFPVVRLFWGSQTVPWAFIVVWVGILAFRWLYDLIRAGSRSAESLDALAEYGRELAELIQKSQILGRDREDGQPTGRARDAFVEDILKAITSTAKVVLGVPDFIVMHSNLMEPTEIVLSDGSKEQGLCIMNYDVPPGGASWTCVRISDIGAGEAYRTGRVEAVEDTHEARYGGSLLESRARCWGSFRVTDSDGRPLGVVNVDASHPYVLVKSVCRGVLMDAITPQLKLMADILR